MTNVTVSERARARACDYLSDIASLRGNERITAIRDDHPALLAFAKFEAEIREECAERLDRFLMVNTNLPVEQVIEAKEAIRQKGQP